MSTQTAEAQVAAAETIPAADLARHIGVLTHDSMQGRDTPGHGLELAARYVADQFNALGLEPFGDSALIHRYPIPGHTTSTGDGVTLLFLFKPKKNGMPVINELGQPIESGGHLNFTDAAVLATDTLVHLKAPGSRGGGQGRVSPDGSFIGPTAVVVAGPHTLESVRRANLRDRVVIYIPSSGTDTTLRRQLIERLRTSNHVLVVTDEDSAAFAARGRAARAHPPVVLEWYLPEAQRLHRWAVYVRAPFIQGVLAAAGFDLAESLTAADPIVREVGARALLMVMVSPSTTAPTAPNTVGLLRGRDPRQVIVLTAHMDENGLHHGQADGATNGADDNASGVAGLIELAKAFKRSGVQPHHSIVFAAVSGGAKELWGSSSLVDALQWQARSIGNIALNINLDMLGSGARDSVFVDGLEDVELPTQVGWIAAKHPELRLTVVDGGTVVAPESDHFAFVRAAVPSLYVHGARHGTALEVKTSDTLKPLDLDQIGRRLRFAFALTQEMANAAETPRWTAAGRAQRVSAFGQ